MVLSSRDGEGGDVDYWGLARVYTKTTRLRLNPSPRSRRSKLGLISSIGLGHCLHMIIHGSLLRNPRG